MLLEMPVGNKNTITKGVGSDQDRELLSGQSASYSSVCVHFPIFRPK